MLRHSEKEFNFSVYFRQSASARFYFWCRDEKFTFVLFLSLLFWTLVKEISVFSSLLFLIYLVRGDTGKKESRSVHINEVKSLVLEKGKQKKSPFSCLVTSPN